jgi:hypothetical protein
MGQAVSLALVPVVLWVTLGEGLECTCGHGDHATCPMHHRRPAGSKRCTMNSATNVATVVLASLFGPLGEPAATAKTGIALVTPSVTVAPAEATTTRAIPPDPPPPRA